ncbi:MAG TPA: amidohydrolase family protein [Chthoniobacterales bacterium]|nr:amidohydrolase family protein [Chthoniobacterales bacterium]
MRLLAAVCAAFALSAPALAGNVSFVGATVINPRDGRIIANAAVVVKGDTIEAVSPAAEAKAPPDARVIDCKGKFILPGYIDTHVHFFQSGGLFTRPDVVDLNAVRPYADELAVIKRTLPDTFARHLRSGITSVVDVGGPLWNFEVRKLANETAKAPRVAIAGPLISSVARPQLDLGDPPIVQVTSPQKARELVKKLSRSQPDFVKIWYVVTPESPPEKFRPIVKAVIEESRRHKLRVAVHATELEAARAAVEEGADLLVHSVTDKQVDEAFVRLMQARGTILTPTLVVFERYSRTFANRLELTPEEQQWGSPEVVATLDVTKLPGDKIPPRISDMMMNPEPALTRIAQTYDVALKNLKTLHDAGIPTATGTDAGNIGTIHGPSIFREFQLMREAGLTPMQILRCTTANGARAFGGRKGSKLGAVEAGKLADLVILNSNPLDDIARGSDIHAVVKSGVPYEAGSLLP